MKKILFPLICLLVAFNLHLCHSQNPQHLIDSMLLLLNTAKEDTNKVKTLNNLSEECRNLGEFERSKKYGEDALQLAEKIKFKPGKSDSHFNIGSSHFYQGNYAEAQNNFSTALQISQELGDRQGMARGYRSLGVIFLSRSNYPEALKNYAAALKFYEEIKDSMGISKCYMNIGSVYESLGNYPKALESHFLALKIAEKKGNKVQIANCSVNISIVYVRQGNYPEALKAQLSALTSYEEIGDIRGISQCYSNIAMTYNSQDNLGKAKEYALKSLALHEASGNKASIATTYHQIGIIDEKQKNYPEALENYFKALKLLRVMNDTIEIAGLYNNLGVVYYQMDQFNEAEAYLNKSLLLASQIGAKHLMKEIYQNFTALFKKQNDFKTAFSYHKLYFVMHDSVFNEAKSQQIAELKVQYETEKKENEIALLNKDQALHLAEIKKQKILKSFLMGGLVLSGLLGFFGYKYSRNAQALKVQTMRNKIASDLHDDVGSTLTSIRLYSEIGKKQTTDSQVSGVFDKIGQNAGEVIQSMGDIVWMINPKYDAFGSVFSRMENFASEMLSPLNIQYTIQKDSEVEALKFSMAERQNIFMIFKEAIHNAAKHANCKTVAIHLSKDKDQLRMNITDDGTGFDNLEIQRGNGLSNMENRAAEINGTITVSASAGKGTSVTLNMLV